MLFYRSTKKKGALSLFYYIVKAIYGKMRQTSKKKKEKSLGLSRVQRNYVYTWQLQQGLNK